MPDEPIAPTPEMLAERAVRANRATRGALGGILGLEALVVLLVPRALAFSNAGLGTGKTVALLVLAALFIVGAGLVRRPWGIYLGTALQVPFILTGIWIWGMFIVGGIFTLVWGALLRVRQDLVGSVFR